MNDRYSVHRKLLQRIGWIIFAALVLIAGAYGYMYATSPAHIRKPAYQHYHFRTQIVIDGLAVDFSEDKFQNKQKTSTACSTETGSVPIDFHDNMDQLTHVHWDGMTGGEFLKYFGWNFIGGNNKLLGWRLDVGPIPKPVKIFGSRLPDLPDNAKFFVYIGDKDNYQQKSWQDFLKQDLEMFFGKNSRIGRNDRVLSGFVMDWLFPKASAHGDVIDEHTSTKSEEELTRINNVIGNVVIFVQKDEPSKEQIKGRFENLVQLHESTCGD